VVGGVLDGRSSRKAVMRFLPRFANGRARAKFHALYNLDKPTEGTRRAFIALVEKAMRRL
jgi:hypothetical protein